jgi:hypothetical protein
VARIKLIVYVSTAFGTSMIGALIFRRSCAFRPTPPSA